jgi:hypothetical protein
MKKLEYFLNKICTIFTIPTNRDFKTENPTTFPQPIFHYFVGKILEIDNKGILVQQWNNNNKKLLSYFFIDHIVSISEEEILNPNDPQDAEVISNYKKANEQIHKKEVKNEPNMEKNDINSLIEMSENI